MALSRSPEPSGLCGITLNSGNFNHNLNEANILTKFHEYQTENVAKSFSTISSSDLVFDPTWPNFNLVLHFIKANIRTKFHEDQTENVASRSNTRFSMIWSSDLVFDMTWPFSNLSEISSSQTFWWNFWSIRLEMWLLEHTQGFSKI